MRKEDYRKIIDELVKKSFPELRGKKIFVLKFPFFTFSGGAFWLLPRIRLMWINSNISKIYSKKAIIGVLVHELCHFERFENRGWFKSFITSFYGMINFNQMYKEERATDKLVVKKGYAHERYSAETSLRKIPRWFKRNYLSSKEIKSYAQKIGKW